MARVNVVKDALQSVRNSRKQLVAKQALLQRYRGWANEAAKRLVKAGAEYAYVDADVGYYGNDSVVKVSCELRKLDGFKDPKLCAALEQFADADVIETKDYAEYLNRDYRFEFKDANAKRVVRIQAYVRSDSESCRKVVKSVETRVVEQKVYELVCD